MKYIHNKAFPYPVLRDSDDFIGCTFQASANWKLQDNGQQIKLLFAFQLSEDNLIQLIERKEAKFSIEVHCSKTYTRKIIVAKGQGKQINPNLYSYEGEYLFNAKDLCGEVTVNCYIICEKESKSYVSESFNDDYQKRKFHIEEGYVLAVHKPIVHQFDTEPEKKFGTFLLLVPDNDLPRGRFALDYGEDKYIHIALHPETKASIDLMRHQKHQKNIFWCAFLFPIILEILHEMQDGVADHDDKQWFIGISKVLKKLDPPIDFEKNSQNDLVAVVQQIMHNPISRILPEDNSND